MMLHPLRVFSSFHYPVQESVEDINSQCTSLFKSFYKDASSIHSMYAKYQASFLKDFKHYSDANEAAYKLLTNKFYLFTQKVFSRLNKSIDTSIDFISSNTKLSDFQVGIIKSYINHHPGYENTEFQIEYDDIGYQTKPFPTPKDFERVLKMIDKGFESHRPISLREIDLKDHYEVDWLRHEDAIEETVRESLKKEFRWKHKYSVEKLIDRYNSYKSDIRYHLSKMKEDYSTISKFVENINSKYAKKVTILIDNETDEQRISIYKNNHQIVSKFIEDMWKLCATHYNWTLKVLLQALHAYTETINAIYKDVSQKISVEKGTKPIHEAKLNAADRRNIPDSDYGIPSLRKYPMPDKAHVLSAIRLSGHCPPEHEAELARRIHQKMKQYGIPDDAIGENNKLYKYIHKSEENRS